MLCRSFSIRFLSITSLFIHSLFPAAAFGQGVLTPSGAPAPTMKTLDQVEARTPIPGGTTAFSATSGGSYYLTGNLVVAGDAITIQGENITLDLNGYTVISTSASSGTAITVASSNGGSLTVRNGHVQGQTTFASGAFTLHGFTGGIVAQTAGVVRVENVTVAGVRGNAIHVDGLGSIYASLIVSHCAVSVAGGTGIDIIGAGSVDHCTATPCGSSAINCQNASVSDCFGYCVGSSGSGVEGLLVSNSNGRSTNGNGIYCYVSATNCNGSCDVSGTGIYAPGSAVGCTGYGHGAGGGVLTTNAAHCYGAATGTGSGLTADTATDCEGTASGAGTGVSCSYTAVGCRGSSATGTGISALTASACSGQTGGTMNTAFGIDCTPNGVATGCQAGAGGAAAFSIRAKIANGCSLGTGSTADITHNVNSF